MGLARLRPGVWLAAAALSLLAAAPAAAQSYSIAVNGSPNMGNVVAASTGPSTFTFAPDGSVTRQSGSAVRASAGTVRGVVQLTCTGQGNACNSAAARVRIGSIGSPTGKVGALSKFTVAIDSGGTISNVTGTNPVEFTVTFQNRNSKPTVNFGAEVTVTGNDGAGAFGSATSGFYAYVSPVSTTPTTGTSGNFSAVVSRPIGLTGSPSLVFGVVTKPTNGSGSVSLNPSNNTRVVGGSGATGVSTPAPERASYTVTGEGGQAISVAVPNKFDMNGPAGQNIEVTLINSGLPNALSNTAGSQGTATFHVGGTFTTNANMSVGDYSGVYNVTAQYN